MPNRVAGPGINYLELGGVVSDNFNGTENKIYTFEGVEGLPLMFNGMVGNNVGATLYGPSGNEIFSKPNFRTTDSELFTLVEKGPHYLVLNGETASARDYSFQMLEFSTTREMVFNVENSGSLSRACCINLKPKLGKGLRLF